MELESEYLIFVHSTGTHVRYHPLVSRPSRTYSDRTMINMLTRTIRRSFYLEPVYRLVPIFSPFLMAALLVRSEYFHRLPYLIPGLDIQDRCALHHPIRVLCDAERSTAPTPVQSFPCGTHPHRWYLFILFLGDMFTDGVHSDDNHFLPQRYGYR